MLGNLDSDISRKKADRDAFVPVEFCKDGQLKTVEYHGAAHIHALSNACGLIHIPRGETLLKKGIEIAVRQIR